MRTIMSASVLLLATGIGATGIGIAPLHAEDKPVVSLTLKDHAFKPSEVRMAKETAFTLRVTNDEPVAAEIEAKRLHVEKVVVPGSDISVEVKPLKPGRYLIVDEYHEDVAKAYIVVE